MPVMLLLFVVSLSSQSNEQTDYQVEFDKAFRSSFRLKAIESCVASAKNAAAAKIDVTPICACVTDRLLATKTVAELQAPLPVSEMQSLSDECIKEHPPIQGSATP